MSFQSILEHAKTPVDFTYLGIGSTPHVKTVEELDDVWDQLVPVFVREQKNKTRRLIHFDPFFSHAVDFLKTYFALNYPELTFTQNKFKYHWTSENFEVIIVDEALEFKNKFQESETDHQWFLEGLSTTILEYGQLIVQDYTGRELDIVFKQVYQNSSNKELFRRKILFDVTYGNASCMTDLTKEKPIYDSKGNFINFLLYKPRDLKVAIGKNSRLDGLIKEYYVKKFREVVGFHHANYRRRTKDDICINKCDLYSDNTKAEIVMGYLQSELTDIFHILKELDTFTPEKEHEFRYLMKYYDQINMYDWNTAVTRLV